MAVISVILRLRKFLQHRNTNVPLPQGLGGQVFSALKHREAPHLLLAVLVYLLVFDPNAAVQVGNADTQTVKHGNIYALCDVDKGLCGSHVQRVSKC